MLPAARQHQPRFPHRFSSPHTHPSHPSRQTPIDLNARRFLQQSSVSPSVPESHTASTVTTRQLLWGIVAFIAVVPPCMLAVKLFSTQPWATGMLGLLPLSAAVAAGVSSYLAGSLLPGYLSYFSACPELPLVQQVARSRGGTALELSAFIPCPPPRGITVV